MAAVETGLRYFSFQGKKSISTGLRNHSFQGRKAASTGLRYFSFRQGTEVTTGLRNFSFQAKQGIQTGLRSHYFTNNQAETGLRYFSFASALDVETGLRPIFFAQDPIGFPTIWKRGGTLDDLNVTFVSSTGGSANLCESHTLVIQQSESSSMTFALQLNDNHYKWHPRGTGALKDVMADGAEVSINVEYGGQADQFWGKFKSPRVSRVGSRPPAMAWPGVGITQELFRSKKTFSSLATDPLAPAVTNRTAMLEMASACSVASDWTGVKSMRILGPFHRQNQNPGDLIGTLLTKLSVDEWRTEYKTMVGYNPTAEGRRWEYNTAQGDLVYEHTINPLENPIYDKAIVLRAIANGQAQAASETVTPFSVDSFGQYTQSFSPPLSGVYWRRDYGSHNGAFSDFHLYSQGTKVAIREARGNYASEFLTNRAFDIDEVRFTWGARDESVTIRGITSGEGAITFYGRPTPRGTVGSGENRQEPLDTTTRLEVGSGDYEIELPPNPLLYNAADMTYHGQKYLARVGRQQVEHTLKLPLNPMIKCGDTIILKKDGYLGGSGEFEMKVVSWQHNISAIIGNRFTTLTCVEYS